MVGAMPRCLSIPFCLYRPRRGAKRRPVRHLQFVMPDAGRFFQQLHRRRTTGPGGTRGPILPFTGYTGGEGRKDQ